MKLLGFWRSAATFRVRMALNYKGLRYTETMVDLDAGEQHAAGVTAMNPQAAVPVLTLDDGSQLTQSMAILEYLEEMLPKPALLPADKLGRARARSLALIWAADHHPLIVPRVRQHLLDGLGLDEHASMAWVQHWFAEGLRVGEARLAREGATGRFCHCDHLSLADLCLMSHVMGARVFKVDSQPYPTINRIAEACLSIDAIARAVPLRQPGAPSLAQSPVT